VAVFVTLAIFVAFVHQKSSCMFSRTYRAGRIEFGVSQMLPLVAVGAV
jgi:hypothetical protein